MLPNLRIPIVRLWAALPPALRPGIALLVALILSPGGLVSQKSAGTGVVELQFTKGHRLGGLKTLRGRFGWTEEEIAARDANRGRLTLRDATFRGYIPEPESRREAMGIVVWIDPTPSGAVPPAWHPILDGARMMAVGADECGNGRPPWVRVGLALAAVRGMGERYRIDRDRVYVAGFSGGAHIASWLALHYPEVFQGAVCVGGGHHFEDVAPLAVDRGDGGSGAGWSAEMPRPGDRALALLPSRRFVFVAGANCQNRDRCEALAAAWGGDVGAETLWVEMADRGHVRADAEALQRALQFLGAEAQGGGGRAP